MKSSIITIKAAVNGTDMNKPQKKSTGFSVSLYGQTYRFLSTEEFSQIIGRSASSLEKDVHNPARLKDRGRVLWCPELYALSILPDNVLSKKVVPQNGRRLTIGDFVPHLKTVGGR